MAMEDPNVYIRYTEISVNGVKELLDQIKDKLYWREKENILDVGCGPGNVTVDILLKYLPKNTIIIGADISEKMTEYANCHYAKENISFKTIDICDKQIRNILNEDFTKVFSFFCLHRVKQREAYQNIYDLLKPGGELVSINIVDVDWIAINKHLAENPTYSEFKEELQGVILDKNFQEDTITLLKSIGFHVRFDKVKENKYYFETLECAYEFLVTVSALPAIQSYEDFLKVLKDMEQNNGDSPILKKTEKGFEYNYVIQSFVARKPFTSLLTG